MRAVVLHDANNSGFRPHCVTSNMEIPVLANLAPDISSQNLSSYVERCLLFFGVIFSDLEYSNYINSFIAHGSGHLVDLGQESF